MSLQRLSATMKVSGGLVLAAGILIHGFTREPSQPSDRRWMMVGVGIAIAGQLLLAAGTGLQKFERRDREYNGDP